MMTTNDDAIRLGVNIDHVATLREARGVDYPSVSRAARMAMAGGAAGITVHLREDRRHIQDNDLGTLIADNTAPVNMELAATAPMLDIAARLRPENACLVPEKRLELTTEGGLDVAGRFPHMSAAIDQLANVGIRVAPFIDPEASQVEAARQAGAPAIEFHTGAYADSLDDTSRAHEYARIEAAAAYAQSLGLAVHGGHGLNRSNVGAIAAIPQFVELNIGHAIVADAIEFGMHDAVRAMRHAILTGRNAN